jgi:hypothetical protein
MGDDFWTSLSPCEYATAEDKLWPPLYFGWGLQPAFIPQPEAAPPVALGCFCPPTSERTCESPACPRKTPPQVVP